MSINKKVKKILIIFGGISLAVLLFLNFLITGKPTKTQLCKDLQSRIEFSECKELETKVHILDKVFPPGVTTSDEIKSLLGEYLAYEQQTVYGHHEVYNLSITPIDQYIFGSPYYGFAYDSNGVLTSFSYQD